MSTSIVVLVLVLVAVIVVMVVVVVAVEDEPRAMALKYTKIDLSIERLTHLSCSSLLVIPRRSVNVIMCSQSP